MKSRYSIQPNERVFGASRKYSRAFTLIELLLVITIIGLLAAVGLPRIKGWGESNSMTTATRQLMDDLALARQRGISTRAKVYVVFVSPEVVNSAYYNQLSADDKKQREKLFSGQYTSYALFTRRSVGDQPGHSTARYLTSWKSLPDKIFIATNKFSEVPENLRFANYTETNRPFRLGSFPFPTEESPLLPLPYLEFNSQGQLTSEDSDLTDGAKYVEAVIPLTKGSIFYARDTNGIPTLGAADVVETPGQNSLTNFNNIRVDWLTGRARLERRDFQ